MLIYHFWFLKVFNASLKVDYKALNADDELRMMLGRTSKNIVKNNRNFRIDLGQKIVRRDPSWPEFKAVGKS